MAKQSSSPRRVVRAIDKNINIAERDLKGAFAFVAKTRANIWLTAAAVLFILGFGVAAIVIPPPGTEAAFNFARRPVNNLGTTPTPANPVANNNCTPPGDSQSEDIAVGSRNLVSGGLNLSPMLAPQISGKNFIALGTEAEFSVKAQFENSACIGSVGVRFRLTWGDGTTSTFITTKPSDATTIKHRYLLGTGDVTVSVTSEYMAVSSTTTTASPAAQFALTINEATGGGPISATVKNATATIANINRGETKDFTVIELTANQDVVINGVVTLGDWTKIETRLYRPPFGKYFEVSGSMSGFANALYNPRLGTTTYNGFAGIIKLNGKQINPAVGTNGSSFSMSSGDKATITLRGSILSGANPCDIVKLGLGFLYGENSSVLFGGPLWGPSYQIEKTAANGRCEQLSATQNSSSGSNPSSPSSVPSKTPTTPKVTPKGTSAITPKK